MRRRRERQDGRDEREKSIVSRMRVWMRWVGMMRCHFPTRRKKEEKKE